MVANTTVGFVARSSARTEVLRAIAHESRSGSTLVGDLSLSRSGVYKALDELATQKLVARRERSNSESRAETCWQVTGCGRLVLDELERHDWLEALFEDREYWLNHDVSGLPEEFRRRLPELRNATLLRNPENDPRYLERYWVERMPSYDRLWAGSRIFHGAYGDAMDDQARCDRETDTQSGASEPTRLIAHAPLVDQQPASFAAHLETRPDDVVQRVCEIPCSFMLTEELFTLSLPLHDGRYDQDSVLVGEDPDSLRFGREFFEFYWEQATPIREYLATIEKQ